MDSEQPYTKSTECNLDMLPMVQPIYKIESIDPSLAMTVSSKRQIIHKLIKERQKLDQYHKDIMALSRRSSLGMPLITEPKQEEPELKPNKEPRRLNKRLRVHKIHKILPETKVKTMKNKEFKKTSILYVEDMNCSAQIRPLTSRSIIPNKPLYAVSKRNYFITKKRLKSVFLKSNGKTNLDSSEVSVDLEQKIPKKYRSSFHAKPWLYNL